MANVGLLIMISLTPEYTELVRQLIIMFGFKTDRIMTFGFDALLKVVILECFISLLEKLYRS